MRPGSKGRIQGTTSTNPQVPGRWTALSRACVINDDPLMLCHLEGRLTAEGPDVLTALDVDTELTDAETQGSATDVAEILVLEGMA